MTSVRPTTSSSSPLLHVRGAEVRLAGRPVIEDANLTVEAGQRAALLGPNGSGKSTLLRACAGILPLTRGEIRLGETPLSRFRRGELARLVALMPQHADVQFPLSCIEAVLLGRSPHKRGLGLADPADLELAHQAMRRLDVEGLAERPVTAVSGGELQRLMFARVLVQQTRLVLLDEPTSAQDPLGILRVQEVLTNLARDQVGILAAVHDLNLALRFFDHVVVLAQGRLLDQGPPRAVLEHGSLETAFGIRLRQLDDDGLPLVVPYPASLKHGPP